MKTKFFGIFCEHYANGERKIAIIEKERKQIPVTRKRMTPICLATEYWVSTESAAKEIKESIEKNIFRISDMLSFHSGYTAEEARGLA
jgi:hypothetical protein